MYGYSLTAPAPYTRMIKSLQCSLRMAISFCVCLANSIISIYCCAEAPLASQ